MYNKKYLLYICVICVWTSCNLGLSFSWNWVIWVMISCTCCTQRSDSPFFSNSCGIGTLFLWAFIISRPYGVTNFPDFLLSTKKIPNLILYTYDLLSLCNRSTVGLSCDALSLPHFWEYTSIFYVLK